MNIGHAHICANRHKRKQVPIDSLMEMPIGTLCRGMASEFQTALKWHMEKQGTSITDLVRGSGVSRDVVNKLLSRPNASTNVENAIMIAAYYGMSVNQFMELREVTPDEAAANLFELLSPEDRQLLEAQIQGILRARASR